MGRCSSCNPNSDTQFACSTSRSTSFDQPSTASGTIGPGSDNLNPWEGLQVLTVTGEDAFEGVREISSNASETEEISPTVRTNANRTASGENQTLRIDAKFAIPQITSLQWQPVADSGVIAYGTSNGTVGVVNWLSGLQVRMLPSHFLA